MSIPLLGKETLDVSKISFALAETVYSSNAVIFERPLDVFLKVKLPVPIPLPLVGFKFNPIGDIPLLAYQWSEYPYLNRESLTNAAVKLPTRFSVELINALGVSEPVPGVQVAKGLTARTIENQTLKYILETYTDGGGTFTVNTLWGTLTGCVLEGFDAVNTGSGTQGYSFALRFFKPQVSAQTIGSRLTNALNKLVTGGF